MMQVSRTSNGFTVTAAVTVTVTFQDSFNDEHLPTAVLHQVEGDLPLEIIQTTDRHHLARVAFRMASNDARHPCVW